MLDDIVRHVEAFLRGDETQTQLEDWLLPETWNLSTESSGGRLASDIRLRFAEFDDRHLDDTELRTELAKLVSAARAHSRPAR